MRTDNRNVKNTIISIYFVLMIFAILLATVFQSYELFEGDSLLILIGLLVVVIFVHFVARYFEYDSDGSNLVITTKGLILTEFINYRENKAEFMKHKVVGFKVNNYFIYKSLVIYEKKGDGKIVKERFNVTLLKRKKLKYVKQSLRKIIKENKSIEG